MSQLCTKFQLNSPNRSQTKNYQITKRKCTVLLLYPIILIKLWVKFYKYWHTYYKKLYPIDSNIKVYRGWYIKKIHIWTLRGSKHMKINIWFILEDKILSGTNGLLIGELAGVVIHSFPLALYSALGRYFTSWYNKTNNIGSGTK